MQTRLDFVKDWSCHSGRSFELSSLEQPRCMRISFLILESWRKGARKNGISDVCVQETYFLLLFEGCGNILLVFHVSLFMRAAYMEGKYLLNDWRKRGKEEEQRHHQSPPRQKVITYCHSTQERQSWSCWLWHLCKRGYSCTCKRKSQGVNRAVLDVPSQYIRQSCSSIRPHMEELNQRGSRSHWWGLQGWSLCDSVQPWWWGPHSKVLMLMMQEVR